MFPIFVSREQLLEALGVDNFQFEHLRQYVQIPTVVLFLREYYILPLAYSNIVHFMESITSGKMPPLLARSLEDLVERYKDKDMQEIPAFRVKGAYLDQALSLIRDEMPLDDVFIQKIYQRHCQNHGVTTPYHLN